LIFIPDEWGKSSDKAQAAFNRYISLNPR